MRLGGTGLVLVAAAAVASAQPAAAADTNFGERIVPSSGVKPLTLVPFTASSPARRMSLAIGAKSLAEAVQVAQAFGRVSSTFRSAEHNRAVGGVPNSYHLRGRAIDLVRAPGVHHSEIDARLRAAGFQLVESLDEHDHSHFAFAWRGESGLAPAPSRRSASLAASTATLPAGVSWKWVYAPGSSR